MRPQPGTSRAVTIAPLYASPAAPFVVSVFASDDDPEPITFLASTPHRGAQLAVEAIEVLNDGWPWLSLPLGRAAMICEWLRDSGFPLPVPPAPAA